MRTCDSQPLPLHIAIYLRHFPLDWQVLGEGTSKAVRGLAGGLARAGARVTVVCEGTSPGHRDFIAPGGARYQVRCFSGGGQGSSFRVSADLKRWLTSCRRPDLVLLNGMFLPAAYVLSRTLSRAGVPYVLCPHDPYNPAMFRKSPLRKAVYWALCERRVLRDSLAVQVLDRRHGTWLRRRGVAAPMLEVPCGHDDTEANALPTPPRHQPDRPPSFYFLGRLDSFNKGLDLLIDGFCAALGDTPARLVLQGPDWGDLAALRDRARRALEHRGLPADRIAFRPPAFDRPPADLMADHDVVCVASRYEGFSLQALEGMLARKVILATTICGVSPFVERADCGVVVHPTAGSVAQGLRALWQRRAEWPEMGARGQSLARRTLHWDDIARRALRQYEQRLCSSAKWEQATVPSADKAVSRILGVRVDPLDMPTALDTIDRWIDGKEHQYVCVRDVHGIMACQDDHTLRDIHDDAGMVTPDGMPLVWLIRRRGHGEAQRVCGPDLMLELCRHSVTRGYRHFLYGGAPGVADDLKANLEAANPGLAVVGTYSPPFRALTPAEDAEVVARINAARPDIVWIGLSSPKQEYWMASHKGRITAAAMIGVGAAFDFHAGRQRRAPLWMQRSGLEWSYRLLAEPRRLWRRYLVMAPRFLYLLARDARRLPAAHDGSAADSRPGNS